MAKPNAPQGLGLVRSRRAMTHPTTAIALDPNYRTMAKTDTDFDPIRTDERFQALLEGE